MTVKLNIVDTLGRTCCIKFERKGTLPYCRVPETKSWAGVELSHRLPAKTGADEVRVTITVH